MTQYTYHNGVWLYTCITTGYGHNMCIIIEYANEFTHTWTMNKTAKTKHYTNSQKKASFSQIQKKIAPFSTLILVAHYTNAPLSLMTSARPPRNTVTQLDVICDRISKPTPDKILISHRKVRCCGTTRQVLLLWLFRGLSFR